jgi:hypothetical protein
VRLAGHPRRITSGGREGWIVPEFAFDPSGRRLLWTENRYPSSARVDQGCLMRSLRNEILARLAGVHGVGDIPFGLSQEIRNRAAELLADPTSFTRRVEGCGGESAPATPLVLEQRTRIGRLLPRHSG